MRTNRQWLERELAFLVKRVDALEEGLVELEPTERLPLALDALDGLEELVERLRQLRAGTLIDLRLPTIAGGPGLTWPRIVELSGREVSPQAVQDWARQYKAPASSPA